MRHGLNKNARRFSLRTEYSCGILNNNVYPKGDDTMKIVVLCGGLSNERDVSISTGVGVVNALRARGHKAVLIDLFFGYQGEYNDPNEIFDLEWKEITYSVGETEPDIDKIRASRAQDNDSLMGDNVIEICRCADMTFLALHGGLGENGQLQAAFDIAGVKYTGSGYLGSAIAMNKSLSKKMFLHDGIPTPPSVMINRGEPVVCLVGYPCVVKPCSGGSSVGTSIVHSEEEFTEAVELAFKYEDSVVVEKYISGRELTVGVIEGRAMPVIEIIVKNGFYDYKNKYQAGATDEICPAQITPEQTEKVQRLAERVMKSLMIDCYCRADFLVDNTDGEIYCIEANTLPGMTPTSLIPQMAEAEGMDFGELCEKIIEVSMKKYI